MDANTRGAHDDVHTRRYTHTMLEAAVMLCVCVCVCVMTVRSLKASPTQALDNRQIKTLPCLSLRIKVEDEEQNVEEGKKLKR